MFMQHNVHSEFKDTKQIAQTVRFDTEEALSTDISDVAVTFEVSSSDQSGSQLTVYTAEREILSNILLSLQNNSIDPITIEPDVNCLSRFVLQKVSLPEDSRCLFAILSRQRGYLVSLTSSQETSAVRTLLINPAQDRGGLLTREIPVTAALAGADEPISCLRVFDSTGSVNCRQLGETLGINTEGVHLAESAGVEADVLADCADTVEFAIAYGTALTHLQKTHSPNFRDDFMPYQGKKRRLQKTLKFLSLSVTVLMIALGMYVTSQLLQTSKYRSRLRRKFEPQYSAVVGKGLRGGIKTGVKKLGSMKRSIESTVKGHSTGEKAISAKLQLVLEAFNKCAKPARLSVDNVSITDKFIRIKCETSGRRSTTQLRRALERVGLKISHESVGVEAGRDKLTITVVPKSS
jgi:hypothetical protein